jgi:hypothetical protein
MLKDTNYTTLPPYIWDATEFSTVENLDPCLALRESLDAYGVFSKYDEDHLDFPDYCQLRARCLRQAIRTFEPSIESIDEKRRDALRKNDMIMYSKILVEQNKKFAQLNGSMVTEGCDHLGMREEVFANSHKYYSKDPECGPKIQEVDHYVRTQIDHANREGPTLKKEEVLNIMKLQIRLNF